MDEEYIRREIQHVIRAEGFWDFHPADTGPTEFARPDIFGMNPKGNSIVIEVKRIEPKVNIDPWLDPAAISEGQRTWLDMWTFEAGGPGYLGVGTIDTPRRLWVIPWEDWVAMEKRLCEKDINFRITLTEISKFVEYELIKKTGGWDLKSKHPILYYAIPSSGPANFFGPKAVNVKPHSLRFAKEKGKTNGS